MNLKQAKRLRKMARDMSVGKPACRYISQKPQMTVKRDADGNDLPTPYREMIRLFECTRLIYKQLKALHVRTKLEIRR